MITPPRSDYVDDEVEVYGEPEPWTDHEIDAAANAEVLGGDW